jgi:uncharacterized protein YegP (UPF0339 family)
MKRAEYQLRQARNGRWYYSLVGANGEVMNSSELYPSRENAQRGAKDAKKASRFAKVEK